MAPPSNRKRVAPSSEPAAKAPFKRPSRPPTAAALAAAEKAKRRDESQQVAIPYEVADKYKLGIKLLLPESVYVDPKDVSPMFCFCVLFCFCKLILTNVSFSSSCVGP
jgi:hypothetical protein